MTTPYAGIAGPYARSAVQVDPAYRSPATDTMAIVAALLGVFGPIVPGLGSIAAIVVGSISLRSIRRTNAGGKWLAVTGIVLGAWNCVLGAILVVEFVVLTVNIVNSGEVGSFP